MKGRTSDVKSRQVESKIQSWDENWAKMRGGINDNDDDKHRRKTQHWAHE